MAARRRGQVARADHQATGNDEPAVHTHCHGLLPENKYNIPPPSKFDLLRPSRHHNILPEERSIGPVLLFLHSHREFLQRVCIVPILAQDASQLSSKCSFVVLARGNSNRLALTPSRSCNTFQLGSPSEFQPPTSLSNPVDVVFNRKRKRNIKGCLAVSTTNTHGDLSRIAPAGYPPPP